MPHSGICEPWDVAVVPFPFIERFGTKRRPAVVISSADFNQRGSTIMAMVTTAPAGRWVSDIPITDLTAAGLPSPCVVRLKLFTLDNRLIVRCAGALSVRDRTACRKAVRSILSLS